MTWSSFRHSLLVKSITVAPYLLSFPLESWATGLGLYSAYWPTSYICPVSRHARPVALVACVPADFLPHCCSGFSLCSWLCSILPLLCRPVSDIVARQVFAL